MLDPSTRPWHDLKPSEQVWVALRLIGERVAAGTHSPGESAEIFLAQFGGTKLDVPAVGSFGPLRKAEDTATAIAILARVRGLPEADVAKEAGRSTKTVRNWVARYWKDREFRKQVDQRWVEWKKRKASGERLP